MKAPGLVLLSGVLAALAACGSVGSDCAEYCGDQLTCSQGMLDVNACQTGCEAGADDDAAMAVVDCFNAAEDPCTAYEECNAAAE